MRPTPTHIVDSRRGLPWHAPMRYEGINSSESMSLGSYVCHKPPFQKLEYVCDAIPQAGIKPQRTAGHLWLMHHLGTVRKFSKITAHNAQDAILPIFLDDKTVYAVNYKKL